MPANQKLRLEAEMKDNASPAIRKLRQELAELQAQTAEARGISKLNRELAQLRREAGDIRSTPGMKAFTTWTSEAGGKAASFMGAIGGLPGVLGAVGIGGIAAGASVAGLASEMKKLGERALDLKELSRETGMSKEFVNSWAHAGEHFRVAEGAMKGMLNGFAAQLPDFERGTGSMFMEFSRWPDTLHRIQEDIRHNSPAKALIEALKQAEQAGKDAGPQVQKQLLESMGLGGDAERLFGDGGLPGLLKELQKPWAMPNSGLAEQAQAYRDATIQFGNAVEKLENTIGPDFLKAMTSGIHGLEVAVEDLEKTFKWMRDFFTSDAKEWNEKHNPGGRFGMAPSNRSPTPEGSQSLMPRYRDAAPGYQYRRNDGHSLYHKSSYDNHNDFRSYLRNASYTEDAGATSSSQFGLRGIIVDGTKEGMLAAFREWAIMGDGKAGDGSGSGGGAGGGGGGGRGPGAAFGGRRGFATGEGGGPGFAASGHKAANNAELMKAAQEQLAKEGVGPEHLKAAAAALVGNVVQESGGDPNKSHDGGTGYGLYGARLDRRDRMFSWLAANGFARNSAEGQMKYMAHEAMTDKRYGQTAAALRMATQGNLGAVTDATARNFERPADASANYAGRRNNAAAAFGADIGGGAGISQGGIGAGGAPVDLAMAMRGMRDTEAGRTLSHYMHSGAWCADFVNGALAQTGGKGTGSALARSFFGWGKHVGNDGIHKGDVLVKGSHVGFATGPAQMHNGRMMIPMISGNHSHKVGEGWARMGEYEARRANGLSAGAAREQQQVSHHKVTVGVEVTGPGRHKSTRVERDGPLDIDVKTPWPRGGNSLLET